MFEVVQNLVVVQSKVFTFVGSLGSLLVQLSVVFSVCVSFNVEFSIEVLMKSNFAYLFDCLWFAVASLGV